MTWTNGTSSYQKFCLGEIIVKSYFHFLHPFYFSGFVVQFLQPDVLSLFLVALNFSSVSLPCYIVKLWASGRAPVHRQYIFKFTHLLCNETLLQSCCLFPVVCSTSISSCDQLDLVLGPWISISWSLSLCLLWFRWLRSYHFQAKNNPSLFPV